MSKGIDIPIDRVVQHFKDNLWAHVNTSFYGRVYRNERFDSFQVKISPEVQDCNTKEYKEVLKDDKFDAQCFFDVDPNQTVSNHNYDATIMICFMVNLEKIYPTLSRNEATEQAHLDVEKQFKFFAIEIVKLITGFEGFKNYDFGKDRQPSLDMAPYYMFRFDAELNYSNTNC